MEEMMLSWNRKISLRVFSSDNLQIKKKKKLEENIDIL